MISQLKLVIQTTAKSTKVLELSAIACTNNHGIKHNTVDPSQVVFNSSLVPAQHAADKLHTTPIVKGDFLCSPNDGELNFLSDGQIPV